MLPRVVTEAGVSVQKSQSSRLIIFSLYSENKAYDATFLQNYAKINLVPAIQRVTGVGNANIFGSKDYSMRIWLKPDVMSRYGLVPDDITNAINEQNIGSSARQIRRKQQPVFSVYYQVQGRFENGQPNLAIL